MEVRGTTMTQASKQYDRLWATLRGECTDEEAREFRKALDDDPHLRQALETLETTKELLARPASDVDHPSWARMEQNVLRQWRIEQAKLAAKPEPRPSLFGWAFSLAGAVAALVLVLWLSFETPDQGTQDAPHVAQDDAVRQAPRVFSPVTVLARIGEEETHFSERGMGSLSEGDLLRTKRDGALEVALGEAIRLTLYPNTSVVFENHQGTLLPRLLRGRLYVVVVPGQTKGFGVLTENATAMVHGTRFLVDNRKGRTVVSVERGVVRVHDRLHPDTFSDVTQDRQITVIPGVASSVEPIGEETRLDLAQRESLFVPPAKEELEDMRPEPRTSIRANKPSNPQDESDNRNVVLLPNDTTPQQSFDKKLETLSPAERVAYEKFFRFIEFKRRTGYTLRAVEELEQYLSFHNDFTTERALYLLGECRFDLQEWDEAERLFRRYLLLHPEGVWRQPIMERLRTLPAEE